jgi:peptidoglycan/LPS O-acetylase OafA/YrhL
MFEQRDFSFIHKYFIAEKQESLFILIIGIIAILLAISFWFFIKTNPAFFKGAAVVLMALGLVQTIVGFNIYTRTDKQKSDIAYNIGMEPASYAKHTELPRMEKVMKNFVIYRWVEIAFIIAGLVLIFLFRSNPDKAFWYGLGLALTIQSATMLGADYFAEQRGEIYSKQLEEISAINKS